MLTVLESIKLSTEYLEKKGIESPRMNAELLLAEILGCKRLDLYLSFDRPLDEDETNKYREYIARRGKFEPLQYITGRVEFYGLEFKVNNSVLIPRPETEILVEKLIDLANEKNSKSILDIGTGSGNITIAAAKYLNNVSVTSIDISQKAINSAVENAELNEVKEKITFLNKDIRAFEESGKFDVIVSNPPYVSVKDYDTLQEEIISYEPREAVTDESDGYSFYQTIIHKSVKLLNDNGFVIFEVAQGQSDYIAAMMKKVGLINIRIIKDYQNIDRVIIGEK